MVTLWGKSLHVALYAKQNSHELHEKYRSPFDGAEE
jgi:hypothetical protein